MISVQNTFSVSIDHIQSCPLLEPVIRTERSKMSRMDVTE